MGIRQHSTQREFVISMKTEQIPSVYDVWSVTTFPHNFIFKAIS